MGLFDFFRQRKRLRRELDTCLSLDPYSVATSLGQPAELTACQKVAVLFLSLPPEVSAGLLPKLSPVQIQTVTIEICHLPKVPQFLRREVLTEMIEVVQVRGPEAPEEQITELVQTHNEQILSALREPLDTKEEEVFASLWDHHKLAILLKNMSFLESMKLTTRLDSGTISYLQAAKESIACLTSNIEVRVLREFLGTQGPGVLSAEAELKMLKIALSKLIRKRIDHVLDTLHLTWPKASISPLHLEKRVS